MPPRSINDPCQCLVWDDIHSPRENVVDGRFVQACHLRSRNKLADGAP